MAAAWERLDEETDKSFAAFNEYLGMPPGERSLARVTIAIGNRPSSQSGTEAWSRKYRWVERAAAYDAYMQQSSIEVRKVGLEEAQDAHISEMTMIYAAGKRLGMRLLRSMEGQMKEFEDALATGIVNVENPPAPIDSKAYNRIMRTMIDIDTGMRRSLRLPTQFKTESVEEPDADGEIYYVGGRQD